MFGSLWCNAMASLDQSLRGVILHVRTFLAPWVRPWHDCNTHYRTPLHKEFPRRWSCWGSVLFPKLREPEPSMGPPSCENRNTLHQRCAPHPEVKFIVKILPDEWRARATWADSHRAATITSGFGVLGLDNSRDEEAASKG